MEHDQQKWMSYYIGDDTCDAQTQTEQVEEDKWMMGVLQQMWPEDGKRHEEDEQNADERDPYLPPELLEEIQWHNELTQAEIQQLIEYDDFDYASDIEHQPNYSDECTPMFSFEQMD